MHYSHTVNSHAIMTIRKHQIFHPIFTEKCRFIRSEISIFLWIFRIFWRQTVKISIGMWVQFQSIRIVQASPKRWRYNRSPLFSLHSSLTLIWRLKRGHWHTAKDAQNVMCHEIIRIVVVKLKFKQYLNFYVSHRVPTFQRETHMWTVALLFSLFCFTTLPCVCIHSIATRFKINPSWMNDWALQHVRVQKGSTHIRSYILFSFVIHFISFRFQTYASLFPLLNVSFSILQFAHLQAASKWLGFGTQKNIEHPYFRRILICRLF